MTSDEATIIRYKAYLKITQKQRDRFLRALISANDLCRSAASIASREGKDTNWKAFNKKLTKSLRLQHVAIKIGGE